MQALVRPRITEMQVKITVAYSAVCIIIYEVLKMTRPKTSCSRFKTILHALEVPQDQGIESKSL